jgi:hypothetical protein
MPVSREGGYACRLCGKVYRKRRSLSRMGYCKTRCGEAAMIENAVQLHAGSGPAVERWLEGIARHLAGGSAGGDPRQDHAAEL